MFHFQKRIKIQLKKFYEFILLVYWKKNRPAITAFVFIILLCELCALRVITYYVHVCTFSVTNPIGFS